MPVKALERNVTFVLSVEKDEYWMYQLFAVSLADRGSEGLPTIACNVNGDPAWMVVYCGTSKIQ